MVDVEGGEQQPRCSSYNPFKALIRDVLADAFIVRDMARKGNPQWAPQAEQDVTWFLSQDESPFSFVWICLHLGLNPDRFRAFYFSRDAVDVPRWWAA